MTDRVPIQQAIEDLESRIELAESTGLKDSPIDMYNRGELDGLRKVESGRIVTAERAALEAMAGEHNYCGHHHTDATAWSSCADHMPVEFMDRWCFPCGARHTLEATA